LILLVNIKKNEFKSLSLISQKMSSNLASEIANELSNITETKTIIINNLTQGHYDDMYNYNSLAYNIQKNIKVDSGYSLMTVDSSYFVLRNSQMGSYVIVSTLININTEDCIEVTLDYCENSDVFARKIINF